MGKNLDVERNLTVGNNATIGAKLVVQGNTEIKHNLAVDGWLDAPNIRPAAKGLFTTLASLEESYPSPEDGWWAIVGDTVPGEMYVAKDGKWVDTGEKSGSIDIDTTSLIDQITAEEQARKSGDATLQDNIDAEATARKDADAAEATAREEGDAALKAQIEALGYPTVTLDSLDTLSALPEVNGTRYVVLDQTSRNMICGVLDVFGDGWGHVTTQVLTSHFGTLDAGSVTFDPNGGHADGYVNQYYRSYNHGAPGLQNDTDTWTEWQPVNKLFMDTLASDTAEIITNSVPQLLDGVVSSVSDLPATTGELYYVHDGSDEEQLYMTTGKAGRGASVCAMSDKTLYVLKSDGSINRWTQADGLVQIIGDVVRTSDKGVADGVVPLDSNVRIDPKYLPESATEVVMIDGVVETLPKIVNIINNGQLYYQTTDNKLYKCVATVDTLAGGVSVTWAEQTMTTYRIYVDKGENVPYRWNGAELVAIAPKDTPASIFNATTEVPISGYYVLCDPDNESMSAVHAAWKAEKAVSGLILSFEIGAGVWKTYQYIGKSVTEANWVKEENWKDFGSLADGTQTYLIIDTLVGSPTVGTYYTLETAVSALMTYQEKAGVTYAKKGLVISYKTGENTMETKQFQGEVSDFGEVALWKDFGGGSKLEASATPEENGEDAFSTGGAYELLPTDLNMTYEDNVLKASLQNAKGETIGTEKQFVIQSGGGGESSGTIVTITPETSPLYTQAGGTVVLKASIRSVTTQGGVEQSNLIERVELYDRDTSTLLETFRLNKASSADMNTYDFEFDLSSYFTQASQRKFKLTAYDDSDHSGSRNINVTAVDVTIKSEQTLNYTASTAVQVGGSTKTLPMYKFPNNASDKGILCTVEIEIDGEWQTLGTATISDTYTHSVSVNPNNCCGKVLTHGAYPLRIHGVDVASGVVGNYLHTAIMVVDSTKTERIVATRWYSEKETATVAQYETLTMDFAVYDPNSSSASVTIVETVGSTSEEKQTTTAQRGTTYTYSHRVQGYQTDGSVTIELTAKSGTATSQVAEFIVSGSLLDIEPVTAQQMFDMDMSGRSNSDADKRIRDNGYELTVSGANYTTNGFVKDSYGTAEYGTEADTGLMALRVAENVTGSLNYAPFNVASIETNGMAVQFRIKTKNIADDDARLISCIANGIGFYVTGKKVVFTTDNAATVSHTIDAALNDDSLTDVAIVIEPSSQAPYSGIGVVKMYFDGELIGACYYDSGTLTRHATKITFDGTEGDLYLYNIRAWETFYSFEQSFDNYLLKLADTDAMITEYEFNNGVMASQTAENNTKNRPQATALYNQGMPYFVLCKNPDTADTTDNYPNYLEGLDGDKKTTRLLDVYAYFPDRPWQDFKATNVTVSNQGTTSSKRPIKNVKMKFKKAEITLLRDRTEFTTSEEQEKYDECAANAAKHRVQPKEGSVPTNIITVKVDYSESGGANNGASTQMYNELQRALGSNYMTPAQNAYTGKYNLQTSIDSIPIAFFRTDQYSSDATSPSYGYFHAKGNWNDDKGDAAIYGFEDCEGYNDGCLNYGDFVELIAAKNQTLDAYEKTLDKTTWDTEQVYVLSEFCGDGHKVFRYQEDAWTETTGTMTYANGKWRIEGDVVNPVECYELLTYNALDWFQGVNTVDDMVKAGSDGLPTWLTYYESRYPDDDDLNAAYEDGRKVPYTLYKWLKWCQDCNHNLTAADGNITLDGKTVVGSPANRLKKFQHELHNEANVHSMICYHLFTDYIAAVDQRSKNMMVGFYLDTDGKERMYLNHLYDGDTILGSDNDCGLTIPAELDPNNDPSGYYQGHDSVLFKQIANSDYIWLTDYKSDSDKGDTTKTVTVADICATMRTTKLSSGLIPFSKEGIEKYWITDRLEKWPKLVSSYDGTRKYLDASKAAANYFYALHGLSIQRLRDYVETRFRYRDGFYGCGDIFSSMIGFRCTGKEMTVTITAAKDGFFGIGVDRANTMRESAYLKAGESATLHSYNTNTGGGIMLYVFGADRIGELDLSNATPKQSGFDISELTLVKKITLGGESYTPATSNGDELATLNLGQLPFLEELDVRNFPLTGIDATYCPRLKSVLAEGTKLQSFTPAEASPLTTLQLPATMTTLSMVNLPKLTYPDGGLTIAGFTNVQTMRIDGCAGIDAVQLLSDAISGGAKIKSVKVPNMDVVADTTVLDALKASGAQGIGSDLDSGCDGLTGRWRLTSYIDEEKLEALRAYFPELDVLQPAYTMLMSDDAVADPENFSNMDNETGYAYGNTYSPSAHVSKILSQRHRVLAKRTKDGECTICQLSDDDSNYFYDKTTAAVLTGDQGDVMMYEPHYWYKGVNDLINKKKYYLFSSDEEQPTSGASVRMEKGSLSYKADYAVSVSTDYTTTDEALTAASDYSAATVAVKGYKQVRWPSVNSAQYGAVFTDDDGNIISRAKASSDSGLIDGMYCFAAIPEGATKLTFTIKRTADFDYVLLTNSTEIEAIEPDWVEHTECLTGVYEALMTNDMIYSWSGQQSTGSVSWTNFKVFAANRGKGYQIVDYEMSKDVANLFFAKYGGRDSQGTCGYGTNTGNRQAGLTNVCGMTDTFANPTNPTEQNAYRWTDDSETVKTAVQSPNVMGYENWHGNKSEWMLLEFCKDSVDYKWSSPMADGTTRSINGLRSTGSLWPKSVIGGRYMDTLIAGTGASSTTYYCDECNQSASKGRVVYRSSNNANAYGGVSYAYAYNDAAGVNVSIGSRLAFRGAIVWAESVAAFQSTKIVD